MTTIVNAETESVGGLVPQRVEQKTVQNWHSLENSISAQKAKVERLNHVRSLFRLFALLFAFAALLFYMRVLAPEPKFRFTDGSFLLHAGQMLGIEATLEHAVILGQAADVLILVLVLSVIFLTFNKYLTDRSDVAQMKLVDLKRQYLRTRFTTRAGWFSYLQIELGILADRLHHVLSEDSKRYAKAEQLRKEAQQAMFQDPNKVNLVSIQSRIAQIKNIIKIEKNEQEAELYWQSRMIAMMLFYVFLVITICSVARHLGLTSTTLIPIFGLNLSTVMWAAVGSLAAILYRLYTFYTADEKIPHRVEFRWLVARPLIGIIMGGLATLAVRTGIIVFTGATPDDVREELGPLQATYWIVAFLAGFSDKFYKGIINLLIERTSPSSSRAPATQQAS